MIALYNVAEKVAADESKVTTLTERYDYSALKPIAIDKDSLPTGLQEIFSIDIPLLPSFELDPQIEGTFRCEPV